MAIEQNLDGGRALSGFFTALRERLSGALSGDMGAGRARVTIDVDDAAVRQAEDAMDRLETREKNRRRAPEREIPSDAPRAVPPADVPRVVPAPAPSDKRFGEQDRPSAWRKSDWGSPEGLPEDRASTRAESLWAQIRSGGAVHSLRSAGGFGAKWGGALGEESREDLSGWTTMAARGDGMKFLSAIDDIEKVGGKISKLTKDMDAASSQAEKVKIADEIIELTKRVEELGKTAGKAADALGGDRGAALREEMQKTVNVAQAGGMQPEKEGGGILGKVGPQRLLSILRNPVAGIQELASEGIMGKLGGAGFGAALRAPSMSGAWSALGGGATATGATLLSSAAALAGGFAAGHGINVMAANDSAEFDAPRALRDIRLSQGMGAGFDFRAAAWETDIYGRRTKFSPQMEGVNLGLAREGIGAMGIGYGRWNPKDGDQGLIRAADSIHRRSVDMGVDGGALAQFVGAQMRSGEIEWSRGGINSNLTRIAGLLEEGNRYGVSSNEKLGVITTLRQQQESRAGYISADGIQVTGNLSRLLDASGPAALRGQAGMNAMQALGSGNDLWDRIMVSKGVGEGGKATAWGQEMIGLAPRDLVAKARENGADDLTILEALKNDPAVQVKMKQRYLQSAEGRALDPYSRSMLMGTTGNLEALAGESVLARGGDLSKLEPPPPPSGPKGEAAKEASLYYMNAADAVKKTEEMLKTVRSLDDLRETMSANNRLLSTLSDVNKTGWATMDALTRALGNAYGVVSSGGQEPIGPELGAVNNAYHLERLANPYLMAAHAISRR